MHLTVNQEMRVRFSLPPLWKFHHLDPNQKDFGIGSKGYTRSFDKVKKELDKCICVCANCHREIHAGLIDIK